MFDHQWLTAVQRAPGANDVWDVESDGYADTEAGHGMFIAGLILQVAPAAEVYVVKVLDSHGVGDDAAVAAAMEQLPQDIDIVNLSLGGYTDDDRGPLAISCALTAMRKQRNVVVAAAGNDGKDRPFWPAAFKQVTAVGAVEQKDSRWLKADFSNFGWWVDAVARGVNLQSTYTKDKTKVAQGPEAAADGPDRHLRGLGGMGRHLVRGTDHGRDAGPHDVAQRARDGRRRARPAALHVTARAAPGLPACGAGGRAAALGGSARRSCKRPTQRTESAREDRLDVVQGIAICVPRSATCSRRIPARRPSSENRPRSSACTLTPSSPGRSTVTVAASGGSSWPCRRRSLGPVALTSSSIPSRGDSKLSCRGPLPPRTSIPASSSASALSRISSASSASTVRQVNAARAASSSSCGTGSMCAKIARSSASVVAS